MAAALVLTAATAGRARADVCADCANLRRQMDAVAAQEQASLARPPHDPRLLKPLVEEMDKLDRESAAKDCDQHMPAEPVDGEHAGVPTKIAVIHLYMGEYFFTPAGEAFKTNTDRAWKRVLADPAFYRVLQQYAPGKGSITGYFADSAKVRLKSSLTQTSFPGSKATLLGYNEFFRIVRFAITSSTLRADQGGTPLFVLYFPPNVSRETKSGSNVQMGVEGWHGQIKLGQKIGIAPPLSLIAVVLQLKEDTNVIESHEIYEAVTNSDHQGWHHEGEELADVCEHKSPTSFVLDGVNIARIWSNSACGCAP